MEPTPRKTFFPAALLVLVLACLSTVGCKKDLIQADYKMTLEFEAKTPVKLSKAKKARLTKALEKHANPAKTRIKVGGIVVWPPRVVPPGGRTEPQIPLNRIRTEQAMSGGRNPTTGQIHSTQFAWAESLARSKSTQVIAFDTEAQMKAFLEEM
jgi:hypothetical protein